MEIKKQNTEEKIEYELEKIEKILKNQSNKLRQEEKDIKYIKKEEERIEKKEERIEKELYKFENEFEWHEKLAVICKYRVKIEDKDSIYHKCTLKNKHCSVEICPLNKY